MIRTMVMFITLKIADTFKPIAVLEIKKKNRLSLFQKPGNQAVNSVARMNPWLPVRKPHAIFRDIYCYSCREISPSRVRYFVTSKRNFVATQRNIVHTQ